MKGVGRWRSCHWSRCCIVAFSCPRRRLCHRSHHRRAVIALSFSPPFSPSFASWFSPAFSPSFAPPHLCVLVCTRRSSFAPTIARHSPAYVLVCTRPPSFAPTLVRHPSSRVLGMGRDVSWGRERVMMHSLPMTVRRGCNDGGNDDVAVVVVFGGARCRCPGCSRRQVVKGGWGAYWGILPSAPPLLFSSPPSLLPSSRSHEVCGGCG